MDFKGALAKINGSDSAEKKAGQNFLNEIKGKNLSAFLDSLCDEFCNEGNSAEVRQLAGIILKTELFEVEPADPEAESAESAWDKVEAQTKTKLKTSSLKLLGTKSAEINELACWIIAVVAVLESEKDGWTGLTQHLLDNMAQQSNTDLRKATLECIGYLFEEMVKDAEKLLPVVSAAMKDPSEEVKISAFATFASGAELLEPMFSNQSERDSTMKTLVDASSDSNVKVSSAALECISGLIPFLYSHLKSYMPELSTLTFKMMKSTQKETVTAGIDFWSLLGEEEMVLAEEEDENSKPQNFVKSAAPELVPVLLNILQTFDSAEESEEWNPFKSAGACLELVASAIEDKTISLIFPFVKENFTSTNQKLRETATFVVGTALEGPEEAAIRDYITPIVPILFTRIQDSATSDSEKKTALWTLGKIARISPSSVQPLDTFVNAMTSALALSPKIAANAAFALSSITESLDPEDAEADIETTNTLSPHWKKVVDALVVAAKRTDGEKENLEVEVMDALNGWIYNAASDVVENLSPLIDLFLGKLEEESADGKDPELVETYYDNIAAAVHKLSKTALQPYKTKLMNIVLKLAQDDEVIPSGVASGALELWLALDFVLGNEEMKEDHIKNVEKLKKLMESSESDDVVADLQEAFHNAGIEK